ncbi:heat shock 70 family protein [Luteolibacter sp. GHJ8]|uniref:Heat shock 70 family protein n=1 Tax=Luteolibacter rhizosphaerae TaxID=2989719 RepID=A0ABT3G7Q7_9BACT|nr:heat shock 70 family protein [Luteolibacter rhizosphaerae]MCW1915891.1 heat shock 70 family protein [Luteolibacter rhizosphaerae]
MRLLDDLLTSYRGAGVIGTCLAFFILVSMVGLSLFAFDPSLNGMWESGSAMVARQQREIGVLSRQVEQAQEKYDVYRESKKFRDAVKANTLRQESTDTRLKEVDEQIAKLDAKRAALKESHEGYVAAYRKQARGQAKGEILPTIVTKDGRTLENPQVVEVNPAGIQLRYANGIVRVSAKDLPEEMWERFQFDDEEMAAFIDREENLAENYEKGVEKALAEGKEDKLKEKKALHEAKIQQLEGDIAALKDRVRVAAQQYARLRPNPTGNYRTLVSLIRQVDSDEKAIRKAELELARLKALRVH